MGAIIFAVIVAGVALAIELHSAVRRRRVARADVRVDLALREHLEGAQGPIDLRAVLESALADAGGGADIYESILDRVDLSRFRPKLADDIEIKRFALRWGNDYVMVANPRAMLYYRLEPWEADMLPLMDGTRTVGEIAVARLEEEGDLDASGATELIQILEVGGFLEPVPVGFQEGLARALDPLTAAQRKIRTFLKTLSIEWTGADRFVRWWYRRILHPFYRPAGTAIGAVIAVAGLVTFLEIERSGRYTLGSRSAPVESLILLGLGFVLTFFHELGHASTIIHFGRRVKSAGFMIYFGSPSFFVEASDSLMLDRRQRIDGVVRGAVRRADPRRSLDPGAGALPRCGLRGAPVQVRAHQLLRDLPEPDPAPGARRLLDPDRPDPGAGPAPALPGVHPTRPVAQAPDAYPVEQAGDRPRRSTPWSGSLFTIFSFYTAYFFWKRIFGGLVSSLWNGGFGSRILLVLLVAFLAGPAIRGLIQLVRALLRRVRAIVRGLVFRAETKWRIEAAELDRRTARVRRPAGRDV